MNTTDAAIARIRELEDDVMRLHRVAQKQRNIIDLFCPPDTIAIAPDGTEVVVDLATMITSLIWLRDKYSKEFYAMVDQTFLEETYGSRI